MRRLLLLLVLFLAALPAAEGDAYRRVMAAAEAHPNRLPGSPGWSAIADAVEASLREAGLRPDRLHYGTLVPRTLACRLEVAGVEIAGVLAMAPNGAMPPTSWGREIAGPVVWLGDGTLAEMRNLPVEGSIALLRMGSPNLQQVFSQGAKAVIVVGAESTQWQASRLFTDSPIASPRAWLPRAAAEAAGLTANPSAPRSGTLRIDVRWADAEVADVWAMIPAAPGGDPGRAAQTIVLAAELATAGAVPELSPGRREAANAALLAETAVRLAANPTERNILVCFLGSHYAGQDGARQFYWVVNKVIRGSKEVDLLADRVGWTAEQVEVGKRRLTLLDDPQLLRKPGDDTFWIRERLRRILVGRVNSLNYDYRHKNLDRKATLDRGDTVAAALLEGELQELKARLLAKLNDMRRQLHVRTIEDSTTWALIRDQLANELSGLSAWLQADAGRLAEAVRLEATLTGKAVIAHAGFDFAAGDRPWFANPFGVDCLSMMDGPSQPGNVVKHIDAWQQAWDRVAANNPGAAAMRSPDLAAAYGYERLSYPRRRQVAAVVPLSMGLIGAQLITLGDPLDGDEMPLAAAASPDLLPLAKPVGAWLHSLAGVELPLKTGYNVVTRYDDKLVYHWDGSNWGGLRVDQLSPGSEEVEGPAAGAVIFVNHPTRTGPSATDGDAVCGRFNGPMARVNPVGYVFCPHVSDQWTLARVSALGFGPDGAPRSFHDGESATGAMSFNIRLFTGFGNGIYFPFLPVEYSGSALLSRLVGRTDSTVKREFGREGTGGATIWTNEERAIKLIGSGLFLLGATEKKPTGTGFVPDPQAMLSMDVLRVSSHDAALLNTQRLEVLRSKNLINRPVERIHAECLDHLESAGQARAGGEVQIAAAHEAVAAVLASRAQIPLREGANDLLRAVVVLLILAIPFAFSIERLVLGAVSIYRQILGFCGVFLATFSILYFTHPAFALANAPLIIFLAFIIILLSAFVISVVMGKFKHELKAMQGLSQKSHATGSGNSTALAAVVIGIAGMRNRPLKTFLTASTVTLLTFTILVFASFESGSAVVESYLGRSRGAERIEVHQPSFLRIPDRLADAIEALHGGSYEVLRRTASFRNPLAGTETERQAGNVLLDPVSGKAVQLDALLGLDQREIARLPAGLLSGLAEPPAGGRPPLWLSETMASRLNLKPGAEVRIRGTAFTLEGLFRDEALKAVENIDGTKLMPPDFEQTFAALGSQGFGNQTSFNQVIQGLDTTSFIFATPALTAITINRTVLELGGMTNVMMLYPKADADLARTASDIAASFNGPIYATGGEGAKRYFYTREITGGGYLDLLVPLLLGGLIIFSSLLGSIVDRQKEIFTYSALGLSPRDVGTLFFAESSVIAVVGGMGGYLIGQAAAKILNLLGDYGLVSVPDMNFSSTSSLVTILIVMAMVLLSTIYPALMASRSANPGVNRAWKMPKPEGDRLVFTFPFTVPEKSFGGIVAFVREHFGNHSDSSLDVFAAKQVELFRVDAVRVGIRSEIALAPFDLGVYQRFTMSTRASDIAGIDEVVVEIERVNGSKATWLRGNRVFIKDLREQFLIWRSLPPEAVEHYQAEAANVLAAAVSPVQAAGGVDGQG